MPHMKWTHLLAHNTFVFTVALRYDAGVMQSYATSGAVSIHVRMTVQRGLFHRPNQAFRPYIDSSRKAAGKVVIFIILMMKKESA